MVNPFSLKIRKSLSHVIKGMLFARAMDAINKSFSLGVLPPAFKSLNNSDAILDDLSSNDSFGKASIITLSFSDSTPTFSSKLVIVVM